MQINRLHGYLSPFWKTLMFHYGRGQGHLLRYAKNRFRWHYGPRLNWVGDFPDHVDLELASVCNMKCPMCYTVTEEFKDQVPAKVLDFDLFKRLVDECAAHRVFSLRLSFRGEPTLHPRFVECARYAKARGIPEISSLTNALKLTAPMFAELVDMQFDWLTISFDGLGKTYDEIRKPATFEGMVARIREFRAIRDRKRSRKPVLRIQTVWPAIREDPQAFYDLFEPIVDQVCYIPLHDYLHKDSQIEYLEDFTCPVPWQRLVVSSDGRILMCINDELGRHIVGDTRQQSLKEIWNSEAVRAVRQTHLRGEGYRKLVPCKACNMPRRTAMVSHTIRGKAWLVEEVVGRPQEIGR